MDNYILLFDSLRMDFFFSLKTNTTIQIKVVV